MSNFRSTISAQNYIFLSLLKICCIWSIRSISLFYVFIKVMIQETLPCSYVIYILIKQLQLKRIRIYELTICFYVY